ALSFGFYLPTRGPSATPEALSRLVTQGEALGFTSVVIADHIVFPTEVDSRYPYTVDGSFPGDGDFLEQLSLMAYVAAKTTGLRLITSVMIVPHRNPVLTAKTLATIDVLSGGRVVVGVGVGWMREEFEALDTAPFNRRGAVTDEYLSIFKTLWTTDPAAYEGEFYSFARLRCLPHPVQTPHPPIWIGGHSRAALRRVARLGDGWHPVGANPAVPLTPDALAASLAELRQFCDEQARDYSAITVSFKAPLYDSNIGMGAERRPFSGSPAAVADDIAAYRALGVRDLIFDFRAPEVEQSLDRMRYFASEIMPLAGG
ncbi:MAG: TIGR03619 family F420-dependent LLM class oxidoreductase, partial [Pseudomonadota bacterium]